MYKMSEKEKRYRLRCRIARYCRTPRMYAEVAERFDMSSISASAHLKSLYLDGIFSYDGMSKKFVRIKGVRVPRR